MNESATRLSKRLAALRSRSGLSALALSRRAGLSINYVRNIERGVRNPRPEALAALCKSLDLSDEETAEVFRLAGIKLAPIEEPYPALTLWRHLPRVLLERVEHDEVVLFDRSADDLIVDVTRGLAPLLAWLALTDAPPSRTQAARLRAAAQRAFDRSQQLPAEVPTLGPATAYMSACDAASVLPRAWRHELFARRGTASQLADKLAAWAYILRGFPEPRIGVRLKDEGLNFTYSFPHATVGVLSDVHDAMIAHRLCAELGLTAAFGAAGQSAQEYDLTCQLSPYNGDLFTLLNASVHDFESAADPAVAWEGVDRLRAAAERVDLALRLYELPGLATSVFRDPGADRPVPRADIEAALRRAVDLVGGLSVRFPGPSPQPTPASNKV